MDDGQLPEVATSIGDYRLVVIGMDDTEGGGFLELASTGLAGELLLDSSCGCDQN